MAIEVIDTDADGLQTLIEFDEVDPRKFHIHHRQDVQPLLERNKELQKHPDYKKAGIKGGMQHVASIPPIWQHHLLKTKGIDILKREHWPRLRKILMDPEYRHLRATLGDI